MPYINLGNRAALDPIIDGLLSRLASLECRKGDVNYCITRIILEALRPATGWDYHSLSDCVSVARDAADEIQRRLLGPYEDVAAKRNDVPCLAEKFSMPNPCKDVSDRYLEENRKHFCKCKKYQEEFDKYMGNHPRTLKEVTEELSEETKKQIDESRGGY